MTIEVCFSPAIYIKHHNKDNIVVIVDVLRATSAICTAFMNGAESIIPVASIKEAEDYKQKGFMVAAERDGIKPDFADFGNSPYNFIRERINGKEIVYSTTNGTQAVEMASECYKVAIGSYLNIAALSKWLISENRNVLIFCSGWKDKFSLEDALFAGALAEKLINSKIFTTDCDSCLASLDLWSIAKNDLLNYIQKVAQRERLRKNGLDDVIEYCHTEDLTEIIPVLEGKKLKKLIQL